MVTMFDEAEELEEQVLEELVEPEAVAEEEVVLAAAVAVLCAPRGTSSQRVQTRCRAGRGFAELLGALAAPRTLSCVPRILPQRVHTCAFVQYEILNLIFLEKVILLN